MGQRLIRVLMAATLLAVLLPSTVLASGDCNRGYVVLWQHADLQGNWVKVCHGVDASNQPTFTITWSNPC